MSVRPLLVLLLLGSAGCPRAAPEECTTDAECGGELCARDGQCLGASDLMSVKVTWTIRGEPPSARTCANHEDLFIHFEGSGPGESIGYAPVPCQVGQFAIDKLPKSYETVEVGVDGGASDIVPITGPEVAVDLPF